LATATPFANYELPATPKADPALILRLQAKGEWFTIKVTEVGELFPGTYGDTYVVKGTLVAAKLSPWRNEDGEFIQAPAVGTEEVLWFQSATDKNGKQSKDDRILQAALREKDVTSLVPGDLLSAALLDIAKPKEPGWKGARTRGFIVDPQGDRSAPTNDPFDQDSV
jgi:hypothetical protein